MQASNKTVARFANVTYAYNRRDAGKALHGVDLTLSAGKITALLGPNGAGKSTLIHLLLGLLPVQGGHIELFHGSPHAKEARVRVGAMLQISGVQDNLTVREILGLFASLYPRPAPLEPLLREAELIGLEGRRLAKLSGGQRQRLLFALALVGNPELLVLDEPSAGLDPAARQQLWAVIERRLAAGAGVLLCTHHLDEAQRLADHVVVLHRGRILTQGSPQSIRDRVPDTRIRARSSLPLPVIQNLAQVSVARLCETGMEVMTTDSTATLAHWLALDPGLHDLEVSRADLETAFLQLMASDNTPLAVAV